MMSARDIGAVAVAVGLAACGPRAAPPTLANAAPTPVTPAPAKPPDGCEATGSGMMTLEGAQVPIELLFCTLGSDAPYGPEKAEDGFVLYHRKAVLVAHAPTGDLSTEIALWDDGWEMGEVWTLVGVFAAPPKTNGAVVLRSDGNGPAPGIEGRQGSLRVMTVRHGEWEEAFLRNANVIDVSMTPDLVTAESCDLARTDTGTGGPGANADACASRDPDQDVVAHPFSLQWDGAAIQEVP
ncbi:MAG: hypothetical protein K8W52_34035 [Deltaproteobacteria bacterium]|nr:hypothetical protein [Deltaproteobacteria bacterium]